MKLFVAVGGLLLYDDLDPGSNPGDGRFLVFGEWFRRFPLSFHCNCFNIHYHTIVRY